jgi:hypothetical protein
VIEASSQAEAETNALDLWNQADGSFSFEDQGIDGVIADELPEAVGVAEEPE